MPYFIFTTKYMPSIKYSLFFVQLESFCLNLYRVIVRFWWLLCLPFKRLRAYVYLDIARVGKICFLQVVVPFVLLFCILGPPNGHFWLFFCVKLSRLFFHNRLEFSFQILNIGQRGCVVVPFLRFIHVTHILGIFGWKNIVFCPKSCPRCFSITARCFHFKF